MKAFRRLSRCLLIGVVVALTTGCQAQSSSSLQTARPFPDGFELRDHIGRSWQNEVVTFPASPEVLKHVEAKHTLANATGKATPYQLIPAAGNTPGKIAFAADLAPYSTSAYHFTAASAATGSDLQIEETTSAIRLFNRCTGITLRKALASNEAPIESVRLSSGQWVGNSHLNGTQKPVSYRAQVTARGPVFSEILCVTEFENNRQWRLRVRLDAGEPVVLLSEEYSVGDSAAWTLDLSENFSPAHILHRMGHSSTAGKVGALNSWKITAEADNDPAFVLEPWLRWWMRDRQGNWLGLYNDGSSDLLALAALRPAQWLDPQKKNQDNTTVPITLQDGKLQASFSLRDGTRYWLLAALDKAQSTQGIEAGTRVDLKAAPLPQQYLIKHGDFPLDQVKDYVLDWQSNDVQHPRLLITKTELEDLRKNFKPDEKQLADLLKQTPTVSNVGPAIRYFLASRDAKLGRKLADFALEFIERVAHSYLVQGSQVTLGFAPHHNRTVQTAVNVADTVWDEILTDAERKRLKAQLAFLGYTFARGDYWSPERGYAANPNMTSMVAGYQAQTGMLLATHPRASEWSNQGLTELKQQLDNWSDTQGGWLEAPAYAMASYDFLLGMFLAAHNTGHNDYLYEPRMKKIADWFAQISTPPDSRAGGIRHLPPIGNTYINQPTGEFGILAYLWKDKDPEFAARMQWMYKQHGEFPQAGIGGFEPSLAGYREILTDASLPVKKPDYVSTLFPETGVLLRNGVDDRETQLHLIAGSNHAHYDDDSGSVTLWGKGRIVADDFGYYGLAPAQDHNRVETPLASGQLSVLKVQSFESDTHFDYVHGTNGGWQRRIAFVKDSDPLAPNYFVIHDSLDVPAPAKWRMWLNAQTLQVKPDGALVVGKEDVDTDIVFTAPAGLSLKTEEKTKSSYGLDANRKYGRASTTQTGLIASVERANHFVAVIYPRIKTQKPPVVTSLADGNVLKIEHEAGTDYIFLGEKPFTFKQDGIDFEGTSGLVKLRGKTTQLALGEGGKLHARGQSKEKAVKVVPTASYNLIGNGDLETGEALPFKSSVIKIALQDGNPTTQGNTPTGRYSMAFTLPENGARNSSVILPEHHFFVDAARTYRVRLKGYTTDNITLSAGGYADDGRNQLKTPEGKVWAYSLALRGPTQGWQQLETTIGPPGSGAKHTWPDKVLSISLTLWLSGAKGMLYLDDFVIEPVVK